MKPYLKVTKDLTDKFNASLKLLVKDGVLVGIPEDSRERKKGEPISNAALLAINNFGSPVNGIPARPVLSIGIKKAANEIAEEFRKAALAVLSKGFTAVNTFYQRAGIIASTSVKKVINDQEGFDGPSDATLKSREAQGFAGDKALIVTGQMRNAITYVVKGEAS